MSFYPTLESIMNLARTFANDAYNGGAGEILTDTAPMTLGYVNGALSDLQDELENCDAVTLTKDNILVVGLDPVANPDPSIQTRLGYDNYSGFNGAAIDANIFLPADFLVPEKLWERQSGSTNMFVPMEQRMEGLESRRQSEWMRDWEWRTDALFFNGSNLSVDLRLRYKTRQPFVVAGSNFNSTVVNIQACDVAMANYIAWRYVKARGGDGAAALKDDADKAVFQIKRRYVRQKQSIDFRRRRYGEGGSDTQRRLPW